MNKLPKFYILMTDSELRAEAWRHPGLGIQSVLCNDSKPPSCYQHNEAVKRLEDDDNVNDSSDSLWKIGK